MTATSSLHYFENNSERLGLSLAKDKTAQPTTHLELLGLDFDTQELTIKIRPARLKDVLDEAGRWSHKTSAQRQEVQSLAGKLNFIATCIRLARKFMGRILATLRAADAAGTVFEAFKKDLNWFLRFAKNCNRRVMMTLPRRQLVLECDVCPKGGGGCSATHYYHQTFPAECTSDYCISQLEALNVVQAVKTLIPSDLSDAPIVVHIDNIAAMYALNTGRTKDQCWQHAPGRYG